MKTIATIALLALATAAPAGAAEFRLVEGEGQMDCRLILGGPDDMVLTAMQGSGVLAPVALEFYNLAHAYPDGQDIVITFTFNPDWPRKTIGEMGEFEGVPYFDAPSSLISNMTGYESYTYQLEGRAPVEMPGVPEAVIKQFEECLLQPQSYPIGPQSKPQD